MAAALIRGGAVARREVLEPRGRQRIVRMLAWPAFFVSLALLIFLLRGYQYAISPLLGPHCRLYPSCSHSACEAVDRHGAVKGSWLTLRRLGRCQTRIL